MAHTTAGSVFKRAQLTLLLCGLLGIASVLHFSGRVSEKPLVGKPRAAFHESCEGQDLDVVIISRRPGMGLRTIASADAARSNPDEQSEGRLRSEVPAGMIWIQAPVMVNGIGTTSVVPPDDTPSSQARYTNVQPFWI